MESLRAIASQMLASDTITDAMHGMNNVFVEGFIDFLPQAVDVYPQGVSFRRVRGPDVVDQFLA